MTLGALLREALLLCGFSDSDAIAWPSRWATAEGEPGLSVLGLRVSCGRFFADNQGGGDTEEGTEVDTADGKERTPFEVMTTADVAGRDGGGDALGGDAEDDAAWLLKDKVKNFAGTLEAPIPYVPKMVLYAGLYYSEDGVTYLCRTNSIVGYDVTLASGSLDALVERVEN